MYLARNADAARSRQRLQPCGDVHPVAIDFPVVAEDVANVDADAKGHPARRGQLGIVAHQFALHLDRTLHRFHGARELGEDVVSRRIDDASVMLAHVRVDDLAAPFDVADGGMLVLGHHAAIAAYVGAQDRG